MIWEIVFMLMVVAFVIWYARGNGDYLFLDDIEHRKQQAHLDWLMVKHAQPDKEFLIWQQKLEDKHYYQMRKSEAEYMLERYKERDLPPLMRKTTFQVLHARFYEYVIYHEPTAKYKNADPREVTQQIFEQLKDEYDDGRKHVQNSVS